MMYTDINKKTGKKLQKQLFIALTASIVCLLGGCGSRSEQVMADMADTSQEKVSADENEEIMTESETSQQEKAEKETTVDITNNIDSDSENKSKVNTKEKVTEENSEDSEKPENTKKKERVKVKGIYVSGPIAGNARMDELIELVDSTELNAMVIDIKNDDGQVTYKMQSDTVMEIGAGTNYISDIEELVSKCKEKNIYLIARIVAFKDPYLAEHRPDLAIKTKSGDIFHDKKGLAWVNPYNQEVWDYLVEIGTQAAEAGFDEIQFDYIRFSTDLKSDKLDFGPEAENKSKTEVITEFTRYAYEQLSALGVYVAADVYGTIIDSKIDQEIVGQDYVSMASELDYICPMVYPSHYANGVYGIPIPDAQPYDTVKAAMDAAAKELEIVPEEKRAINRVWIQSFTASWVEGHISYGPKQIREQIHGAFDAGYDEWILWNAAVKYQRNSLLSDEEAEAERIQWEQTRNVKKSSKPVQAEKVKEEQPTEEGQDVQTTQSAEEGQNAQMTQSAEEGQNVQMTQSAEEGQNVQMTQSAEEGQNVQITQPASDEQTVQVP